MNRKQMAEKLLEMFGYDELPVKWSMDYALEFNPEDCITPVAMYVEEPSPITYVELARINGEQHEHVRSLNLPVSYHLLAILHEIGHLESCQEDYDTYEKDLETLEIMYRKNLIDEKNYISLYNSLENEKNADNWAINWVKNNKKLAIMLDKQLD